MTAGTSKRSEKSTDQMRPVRSYRRLLTSAKIGEGSAAWFIEHHIFAAFHAQRIASAARSVEQPR